MRYDNICFCCVFLAVFLFVGCAKKAVDVNEEFIGTWVGAGKGLGYESYIITIDEKSNGRYEEETLERSLTVAGKARVKKNYTILKIGLKKFSIDQAPTEVVDTTGKKSYSKIMVLDGMTWFGY